MANNTAEVREILEAMLRSFENRMAVGEVEAECVSLRVTLDNAQEDLERALRLIGEADDEGQERAGSSA